jgi:hypothetical protein
MSAIEPSEAVFVVCRFFAPVLDCVFVAVVGAFVQLRERQVGELRHGPEAVFHPHAVLKTIATEHRERLDRTCMTRLHSRSDVFFLRPFEDRIRHHGNGLK